MASRVEINVENGRGTVSVDGQQVGHLVTGLHVDAEYGDRPTVVLELKPTWVTMMYEPAEVTIDADTEELLLKLGWRKP